MNRIESAYTAFRATVVIPRDKSWDDILLVKPAVMPAAPEPEKSEPEKSEAEKAAERYVESLAAPHARYNPKKAFMAGWEAGKL